MVVEDEELLRLAVSRALRKRGFSVMEASDTDWQATVVGSYTWKIPVVVPPVGYWMVESPIQP